MHQIRSLPIGIYLVAIASFILIGSISVYPSVLSSHTVVTSSRITTSSDDAEERVSTGRVNLTSSDLELGAEKGTRLQLVGMRFTSIAVPSGATITNAYIEFEVDEVDSVSTDLTIMVEESDNAPTFVSQNSNISSRTTTGTTIPWNSVPAWSAKNQKRQTPDIRLLVQEIVNRPGWSEGGSMVFMIEGTGERTAEAYDGEIANAPMLVVEYATDGSEPPSPTPIPNPTATPTPYPPGTLTFAVIGDYGVDNTNQSRVASVINSLNPDFIVTTGDNNYPDGEAVTIDDNIGKYFNSYIGNYQGSYGTGSPTNKFWPSLGNHDWHTISCAGGACSGAYFDYFTLPGNERYYNVDLGLVHLFAVDSDSGEPDGRTAESAQAAWLQSALSSSTSCYNIVFFHHAAYSSSRHGSNTRMQWPFATWGADVVLTGHDHVYERLEAHGIPYIVAGAGGAQLYTFDNINNLEPEATSHVRYNQDHGVLFVTATTSGITYNYYNANASLVDSYTIPQNCSGDTPYELATLVSTIDTSVWSPPSPDPAGLAFDTSTGYMYVVDSEVEEMTIYQGYNLFGTIGGSLASIDDTTAFSREPTGIAYNPANGHFFFADDGSRRIYEVDPGPDRRVGTDDDIRSFIFTSDFQSTDPEGLAYHANTLYIADGVGTEVYALSAGANGVFDGVAPAGDDQVSNFDVGVYGVLDPEGVEYNPENNTLFILDGDRHTNLLIETTLEGALVRTIDISSVDPKKPGGMTYGPASDFSGEMRLYVVDRGVDNNTDPTENDGKIYELSISSSPPPVSPSPTPIPSPTPTAIASPTPTLLPSATPVPSSTPTPNPDGQPGTASSRITASSDDAEERVSTGRVNLTSSDLELGAEKGTRLQLVGMRFTSIAVPSGATITNAYIEFEVDEVDDVPTDLSIMVEASDNAPTFVSQNSNISSRTTTGTTIPWNSVPAWSAKNQKRQTPDIRLLVQEIVNRPGWSEGGSMVFMIEGTGERTAEAYDGEIANAPMLVVEYIQ